MISITQDLKFKQAVVEYSFKHGVTAAAKRYKRTRQWIYYWRKRYDGTIRSLAEYSRRPHSHPNAHTDAELNRDCFVKCQKSSLKTRKTRA